MDKTAFLDEYFFAGDKFTKEGQEFLDRINGYRTDVSGVLGADSRFTSVVKSKFSTNPVINSKTKLEVPFLKARYEGFPLVASLTSLTQMQADIKNTESDIVRRFIRG